MKINIEIRSEILNYSLIIEDAVNSLLLAYLGITNKTSTKLFGTKAGISFKNKIDLLYDIDVLTKKEHNDLELQMIFRNKFIHSIECSSFTVILSQLDNGIKNRFKKYISSHDNITNEKSYKEAYGELYSSNLGIMIEKIGLKKQSIEDKNLLIQLLLKKGLRLTDISFNFIDELLEKLELVFLENIENIENKQVVELTTLLRNKCVQHSKTFSSDKELLALDEKLKTLLSEDKIRDYLK